MRNIYCTLILLFSFQLYAKDYSELIEANNYGEIETVYLVAMAWTESSMRPNIRSHKDCLGLMQIHINTANDMGFVGTEKQLLVPSVNVKYAIKYVYWIYNRYRGHKNRLYKTFDAYNRGIGNVEKWPYKMAWADHKYVGKILTKVNELEGN